jgi:hypothetical protein
MLKRLGTVVAVAGVGALAVSSVGPATGGSPTLDGDHRHTIRVVTSITEEAFVDVGKHRESLGDSFVFTAKLTRHGKKVGHVGVVCTITSLKRGESQCVGTARLRHGQISIQGLVPFEGRVFTLPITGGTGAFEAAGGTLVVRDADPSDNREHLTFHIVH